MDFTSLTTAVDVSTVVTALLAVGALTIGPRIARMGVRWIKGAIN